MTDAAPNKPEPTPEPESQAIRPSIEPLPEEVVARLPKEVRAHLTKLTSTRVEVTQQSGAAQFVGKFTDEHVSAVLSETGRENERHHAFAVTHLKYQFAAFVVMIAVVLFLVWLLQDQPTILSPVLAGLLAFAAGFGAGFGVGKKA